MTTYFSLVSRGGRYRRLETQNLTNLAVAFTVPAGVYRFRSLRKGRSPVTEPETFIPTPFAQDFICLDKPTLLVMTTSGISLSRHNWATRRKYAVSRHNDVEKGFLLVNDIAHHCIEGLAAFNFPMSRAKLFLKL